MQNGGQRNRLKLIASTRHSCGQPSPTPSPICPIRGFRHIVPRHPRTWHSQLRVSLPGTAAARGRPDGDDEAERHREGPRHTDGEVFPPAVRLLWRGGCWPGSHWGESNCINFLETVFFDCFTNLICFIFLYILLLLLSICIFTSVVCLYITPLVLVVDLINMSHCVPMPTA